MRFSQFVLLLVAVSFCPACGGCGHDKVVIKDERPAPAPTVTVVQPAAPAAAPAPAPAPVINNNK